MAWLSGWSYRKKITVTGQSGAGNLYQVKFSIGDSAGGDFDLESHCTNFPQDIQVTDDDGVTPLDYWVEDLTVDPIQMWVEVADSLDSNADVCVYYGKSGASTESNIGNTFLFGDDFNRSDGTDIGAKWGEYGDTNWAISTNRLSRPDSALDDTVIKAVAKVGGSLYSVTDIIVESKCFVTALSSGNAHVGIFARANTAGDGTSRGYELTAHGTITTLQLLDDRVAWKDSATTTQALNEWWNWKLQVDGDNMRGKAWEVGTSEPGSWTVEDTSTTQASGYIGAYLYTEGTSSLYYDDFRARKYNSPEPAYLSASAEEIPVTELTITKNLTSKDISFQDVEYYNKEILANKYVSIIDSEIYNSECLELADSETIAKIFGVALSKLLNILDVEKFDYTYHSPQNINLIDDITQIQNIFLNKRINFIDISTIAKIYSLALSKRLSFSKAFALINEITSFMDLDINESNIFDNVIAVNKIIEFPKFFKSDISMSHTWILNHTKFSILDFNYWNKNLLNIFVEEVMDNFLYSDEMLEFLSSFTFENIETVSFSKFLNISPDIFFDYDMLMDTLLTGNLNFNFDCQMNLSLSQLIDDFYTISHIAFRFPIKLFAITGKKIAMEITGKKIAMEITGKKIAMDIVANEFE